MAYVLKGTKDASNLEAVLLTVEGEPIQSRVPQVPVDVCPRCGYELFSARPTTVRMALLRQLETHSSKEPTLTRELAVKILRAPDPLTLENAEVTLLQAAVHTNGFGYRDWVQSALIDFLKTAIRQTENLPAEPATEE